jgi:glycosyltransferase involved in cell wall biosynthesis
MNRQAHLPAISVIICTHNRADLLRDVLQTLVEQTLEPQFFEVLVVDNQSTDDTRIVVQGFSNFSSNIKYILEEQLGVSYARNRGWHAARGAYVGFTDDDCRIPANWLEKAQTIIQAQQPAIFGGPYFAHYREPKPAWFKDAYGSRHLGQTAKALEDHEYLSAGNLFIERELIKVTGGFPEHLGPVGNRLAYGEETVLQMHFRALLPERKIYYFPDLYVYHLVRMEKFTPYWLAKAFFKKGQHIYATNRPFRPTPHSLPNLLLNAVKTLIGAMGDCVYGFIRRDRKQYPYLQNYLYEHTSRYLRNLGKLYAQYQEYVEQSRL